MSKPNSSKTRILPIPEARDLKDAVRKALSMQVLLSQRLERGVPAECRRFAAVLTDQGELAVVEINNFSLKRALPQCAVGSPEALQAQVDEDNGRTTPPVSDTNKMDAEKLAADGWRLWGKRKPIEAEATFKQVLEKDPNNADAYNGLGWAQLNQEKFIDAKKSFEKCLEVNPRHAAALNGLGWTAKGQGETDEAIVHWQKAVKVAPGAMPALWGLAQTRMDQGRYNEAAKYYRTILKYDPNSADAKSGSEKAKTVSKAVKAAVLAAENWLRAVDEGRYDASWDTAAGFFKAEITKKQWLNSLNAVRTPLGKIRSRKVLSTKYATSLPGPPDGECVVIQCETAFENKQQAVETIIPMKDTDRAWRVSNYYIR